MAVQIVDIKAPKAMGPTRASATAILVNRGKWVQPGDKIATLAIGEKKIDVTSTHMGVIMKVLATPGDSVAPDAVLFRLKVVQNGERPNFHQAWTYFSQVNKPVDEVGDVIGGKVKSNIDIPDGNSAKWTNACPIRMSYVLNRTGFPIQRGVAPVGSGGDKMWYIFRVNDMLSYLYAIFGAPDIEIIGTPQLSGFKDMQGILLVTGSGWSDARGHITLWNGMICSDRCHLTADENGPFKPSKAVLWVLP